MEFTPKQFDIFADFKRLVGCVTVAVQLLDAAVRAGAPATRSFEEIQKLEQTGDEVMRRALRELADHSLCSAGYIMNIAW